MHGWTALCYPGIEPPIGWLRSAALFFDTVASVVPAESDDTLSDELRKFADATGAWRPERPHEGTALLVDVPLDRLDQAFEAIAAERGCLPGQVEVTSEFSGGDVRVKNHVFMHGAKLSPLVRERLSAHSLMLPKEFAEVYREGDWWLVDERASNLILTQIADKLAGRRGWSSITDNEGCYAFNALDRAETA